jgi:hypothetical protein
MTTRFLLVITIIFSVAITPLDANVVTKGVRELTDVISKQGSKSAARELAEFGGKEAVQATLEKAAREGGEELVEKVVRYGRRYGVSAVRAINHAPAPYIKALDGLPEELVEQAIWAVQREPELMTRLVRDYGSDALLLATKHRGIGGGLVNKLGSEGVRLGKALSEHQAVVAARHADTLASLPQAEQSRVIGAIVAAPARALDFLERHPKILLTSAGVGTFIALQDEMLGQDEEIRIAPDGTRTIRKRGFIERILEQFRQPIVVILSIAAGILALWGLTKIWGVYRLEKMKMARRVLEHQQHSRQTHAAKSDSRP